MKSLTLLVLSLALLAAVAAGAVWVFSSQDNGQEDNTPSQGIFVAGHGTHLGMSAETEAEIKRDYLNLYEMVTYPSTTIDDVSIIKYYGTYNGSVVVKIKFIWMGELQAVTYETIDNITITFPTSNKALVWKDGNFCSLQEAYDNGLLTKDDLERVAGIWPSLYWQTEKQIRQGYADSFIDDPTATADGVWIEYSYGRYYNHPNGDTEVLMMWHKEQGTTGAVREVYIVGVRFVYNSGYSITAWNQGSFYGLQGAYDLGLLTKGDIERIAEHHRAACFQEILCSDVF